MNTPNPSSPQQRALRALSDSDASIRLQAALALGTHPDVACLDVLIERCAVEPDFFVRDMLTWAIMQLPAQLTLPRLRTELESDARQARSQALHTLSKIGDQSAWPWITRAMLRDPDAELARTAWRAAAALAPDADKPALVTELVSQLGRGDRSLQRSLTRAFLVLGEAIVPALTDAAENPDWTIAAHARATLLVLENPGMGFDAALDRARSMVLKRADLVDADD